MESSQTSIQALIDQVGAVPEQGNYDRKFRAALELGRCEDVRAVEPLVRQLYYYGMPSNIHDFVQALRTHWQHPDRQCIGNTVIPDRFEAVIAHPLKAGFEVNVRELLEPFFNRIERKREDGKAIWMDAVDIYSAITFFYERLTTFEYEKVARDLLRIGHSQGFGALERACLGYIVSYDRDSNGIGPSMANAWMGSMRSVIDYKVAIGSAIGQIGGDEAVSALILALESDDPIVVLAGLKGLIKVGEKGDLPNLNEKLQLAIAQRNGNRLTQWSPTLRCTLNFVTGLLRLLA